MADGPVDVGVEDQLFAVTIGPPVTAATPSSTTAKTFRHYDPARSFLLPPSLDDWLPEDHEARFISEVVDDLLDLSAIYGSYETGDGAPPYDPRLMLKLLRYGYSIGVTSSREIERRCATDVAFRFLSANAAPDYRSVARFRRRHLRALDDLFTQVLSLCKKAGLVTLGRVALDGAKLRASASRHKAMSHDRMGAKITQLENEVVKILAEAEATDQAEDRAFGVDRRGDEVPAELARRETRLARSRAWRADIERCPGPRWRSGGGGSTTCSSSVYSVLRRRSSSWRSAACLALAISSRRSCSRACSAAGSSPRRGSCCDRVA